MKSCSLIVRSVGGGVTARLGCIGVVDLFNPAAILLILSSSKSSL